MDEQTNAQTDTMIDGWTERASELLIEMNKGPQARTSRSRAKAKALMSEPLGQCLQAKATRPKLPAQQIR